MNNNATATFSGEIVENSYETAGVPTILGLRYCSRR